MKPIRAENRSRHDRGFNEETMSEGFRNVEDIQEETSERTGRLGTLFLASLGGALLVFAAVALVRRPAPTAPRGTDPLADLAGRPAGAASAKRDLSSADVTFPGLLSDDPRPTTALAAIQGGPTPSTSSSVAFVLPPGAPSVPPPAGDRLPVVPLPAQRVLAASPVVTNPRDPLTVRARDASSTDEGTLAQPGSTGRFVLQVSSFKTEPEAVAFSRVLRSRGHHAYVESANITGRGTWHRVRIGPFKTSREANSYRSEFERKEHIVPFLVESEKERSATASRTH